MVDPGRRWRGFISHLAWERRSVPIDEVKEVNRKKASLGFSA